ncbi:site-specific integrase [Neoroseomonas rubea]|uniref:site-specific integrase n=1 Tax=Neoroseomonas rubea TaxID=2748666 RepID=UPI0018DF23F9|nr:site-specific integrase [Roseomonas rubea]
MPKLSEKAIAALSIPTGKREAWLSDAEVAGLRVRAMAGQKTFYACWTDRASGERRRERLGTWGALTLEKAREAARAILGDLAKNIDPAAVRRERREAAEAAKAEAALTLAALVDDWAALHLAHRRPRYRAEAVRALRHAFAVHLTKPAARLTKAEVVAVLDGLTKGGHAAMAGRTLAYGRACYTWAVKRGRLPSNPFAGVPVAAGVLARERVLSAEEVGRIWNAAMGMAEPFGPLFRVLLLTLARREEVAGMRWSELSADLATWTIPGNRMKRGAAHVVALPEAAREALRTVKRINGQDLVFSTTGKTPVSGFTKAKTALDKAAKVTGWRLHDMRRSGVSALAAMGFNPVVADLLLAHRPATLSSVARVYQRHDYAAEREAALKVWAEHVLRCAKRGEGEVANVTSITEHRAKQGSRR